jgi:rubrerythrin
MLNWAFVRSPAEMTRLVEEPKIRPRDLPELFGVARALEERAAERYAELAAAMERLGAPEIAATFLVLLEEQRDHIAEIDRRAGEQTGEPPPLAADATIPLPEAVRSWEEAAASALLTPYRALAVAVENEVRSFAFYSYVAAHSEVAAVRAAAERFAAAALEHAAILRKERRRAFRREAGRERKVVLEPGSLSDFLRQSRALQARAALRHRRIADALAALHQAVAARAIGEVAEREFAAAGLTADEHDASRADAHASEAALAGTPLVLLRDALGEAERVHGAYLDLADRTPDEAVLAAAQAAAAESLPHIAAIAACLRAAVG